MTPKNIQAAELLESAAFVIMTPGWWTTRSNARDAKGHPSLPHGKEAACFCSRGALKAAQFEKLALSPAYGFAYYTAMGALAHELPKRYGVLSYNDAYAEDGIEMADYMWRAADKLRRSCADVVF